MIIDEYIQFISKLSSSENKTIKQIGHCFKQVFCGVDSAASEGLLARVDEISSEVNSWFPSGFAEKYGTWQQKINDFHSVLESGVNENIKAEFKIMFAELKATWMMLLEFLPFLFMLSINRMDKRLIFEIGKNEFEKAFSIYKMIFHNNEVHKIEENKCKLTIYLIQLFRKLYSQNAVSSEFILRSIMKDKKAFDNLFLRKFNSAIWLFSKLDNGAIDEILRTFNVNASQKMSFLSNWTMFDIIDTITPIFRNFYLVYIEKIKLDEKPYLTEGISISSLGDPKNVKFRLLPGHRSDSTRLQKSNLYLINRKKQIGFPEFFSQNGQYLTPEDYMNLTPLMLYTTFKESSGKKLPDTEIIDQRELFVFHGYDNRTSEKFLKFLEFSGKRVEEVIKSKKSQSYRLFEEYEAFSKNLNDYYVDIEKIIKKIVLESKRSIDKPESFDFVYKKTWELSLGHISSLLRVEEYDSEAVLHEALDNRNEKVKFIERVFVSPKEEELLEQFASSDKRGFIVIGKSGMGKSNLLCYYYLKQRRRKDLNIFIDARRLDSADFKNSLKKSIAARINTDWGLEEFDNYLQSIQKEITIIIDAVNEFNNVGGAIGLLGEICDFVEDSNIFKNIKIIASCRNETWDQYKTKIGYSSNVLNNEYFFTQSGDAIPLSGFEEEMERELLYSAYRKYYKLKPDSYHSLSPAVKALIKQPFMMGFIAEIYSNRFNDSSDLPKVQKRKKIPKYLDYFILFEYLTERKKNDAKRMLSNVSEMEQENFGRRFDNCLFWFARFLYDKIVEPAPSGNTPHDSDDKSDSLKIDQLDKNIYFNEFFNLINPYNNTTTFSAIVQVGLIERIYIDEYDYWGNKKSGRAYKFFHDQYTQFWLSAVFSSNILGRISSSTLNSDTSLLDAIVDKIETIIEISQNAPVLSGALYHWLYNNVFDKRKNPNACLTILFNRLAGKNSNTINYFEGSFLHWLIDTNIISAQSLTNELVKNGSVLLRKCYHEHILQIWPEISLSTFQAIIAKETDETLIRRIGDIFVNLFTLEPSKEVIEFLDKALVSYERKNLGNLTKKLLEKTRLKRDFIFSQIFITSSLLCNFSDPKKLTILKNFLKRKYNWILAVITDKKATGVKGAIRDMMYHAIENSGIYQWNQAIGSQGGNHTFFVKDEGLVQRDVLCDFYKYCTSFHNGNMEIFSLDIGSEYMAMTLKMMKYKHRSIIGYVATLTLVGVLTDHMEKIDEIVDEIIKLKSKTALSFGIALVHMLAKIKPNAIEHILDIIHKKFLPEMIDSFKKDEYIMTSVLIIGAIDFDRYWEKCEIVFSDIISHLHEKGDKSYIEIFGEMQVESLFLPNIMIGVRICDYLLKKKLHEEPLWREFTLKMLACMLARSPRKLKEILDENMIKDIIINEARPFLTEDIIKARTVVSYENGWNNFLVFGFLENKKLRYLLITYLLGGLVQSNCVEEFVKTARKLIVEGIRIFLMDDTDNDPNYENLTIEETLPGKDM